MTTAPEPGSETWHAQVVEEVIEPDRPIVDPHHHLWPADGALPYGLTELQADTGDGHNIEATVFVECHAAYRTGGPAHLQPVGETDFVAAEAARAATTPGSPPIAAIVGRADLRLPTEILDEVLDAHEEAGAGLFRGIRHALSRAPEMDGLMIPGQAPAGLAQDPDFRSGVARLGERGLTYDSWHYVHQNPEFAALAAAVPGTTMILDHFGTPIGVGDMAGKADEQFATWSEELYQVAANPNVVIKLGGMAMPDNGHGWHLRSTPATSDELVGAQARYYLHAIEVFGPDRCMFESNFPVDRFSLSYRTVWNAFKKLAASFSEEEKEQMFRGTARRVYGLD